MPVEWAVEIQPGKNALRGAREKPTQKRSWIDWKMRSAALEAAKNWTGMRDWAQRWTEAEPEESSAWMDLGTAYSELKRYPESVEAYEQMVRIDPSDVNSRVILAIAYAQAGDRTAAFEELRRLRRIDPAEANKLVKFLEKFALENISVAAGWVIVGSDKSDTQYANPSTIRTKGKMVTMWDLMDFKKPQVLNKSIKPYLSMKSQSEYDCAEEQMRTLSSSLHSGHMGKGNVVYSDSDPSKWVSIPPRSRGEGLWSVACGKGR